MSKVRGSMLLKLVKALRHYDRWDDVSEELRSKIGNRVSLTAWYEADSYIELVRLLGATLEGRRDEIQGLAPDQDIWDFMGGNWADSYFEACPFDLSRKSPEQALSSFYSFWKLRHNSADPELELSPGAAEIVLPPDAVEAPEFCAMMQGAIRKTLAAAGAQDVQVTEPECRTRNGGRCRWLARWSVTAKVNPSSHRAFDDSATAGQ